jgi:GMP reductase
MRVEADVKMGFKDVLIRPKRSTLSSRAEVRLERTFTFIHSKKVWQGIPLIAANMDTVGTFEVARVLAGQGLLTALHKHYSLEQWTTFLSGQSAEFYQRIMISTGTSPSDFERLGMVLKAHPQLEFICIDVANGYAEAFVEFVGRVRQAYPDKTIVAGNVVTGEMVEELLLSGADLVKVGIGPGSVCTTRLKTGVGYPQLSAVIECADAAHGLGGRIISDGGCVCAGDVAKAFGAGADFVMLGGMFAGHDESGGELVQRDGQTYKLFYGMSSSLAMEKHAGGVAEYRSSEGKTVEVPYRGPIIETVRDILGGVRSACTYVGASALKELTKRTTFIRVLEQENQTFG